MKIPELIKNKRKNLKESQEEFGNRFKVTHASVSDWELGKSEAPYEVIYFVLDQTDPINDAFREGYQIAKQEDEDRLQAFNALLDFFDNRYEFKEEDY